MFWTGGRFWEVVAIEGLTLLKRENWSRVGVTYSQAGFFFHERHGREGITIGVDLHTF